MSFSSLPPELVHQIIESTVPHTFHSTTYNERQRTLCRLSLVSKRFRSIAQPLLFEIVGLGRVEDVEKLPITQASGGDACAQGAVRCLVVKKSRRPYLIRKQEDEDRFAESLRVFATASMLALSRIEATHFILLLSLTSQHLTYLQITSCHFEVPANIHLPNLRNLTLYDVPFQLFTSLLDSSVVPNLQNFAFVDSSQESAQWLKEPSISSFLLQLRSLHMDAWVWLKLDESFRQSAASRTLVNIGWGGFQEALNSTPSIEHARIWGSLVNKEDFDHENFCYRLDSYTSFIERSSSLSLRSFYLDSSFQPSSTLPGATRSSINNLARICQERKIDLIFDQVPISYETDRSISSEFIRRQRRSRKSEPGADVVRTGQE